MIPLAEVQRTKPKPGFRLNPLHPLSRGLQGWWLFNEGGGSILHDQSGNENHGTLTGMDPQFDWVASPLGGALEFDGVDDYVDAGSDATLDNLGPLTYAAWIYPRSLGEDSNGEIINKGFETNHIMVATFQGTNVFHYAVGYASANLIAESENNTVDFNEWQHVVVTWDGTSNAANGVGIYKNGLELSHGYDQDGSGNRTDDSSTSMIIGNDGDVTGTFDGIIDDVRIYNRALNAVEIQQLYSNPYANVLRQNTTRRRLFHLLRLAQQRNRLFSKVGGGLAR